MNTCKGTGLGGRADLHNSAKKARARLSMIESVVAYLFTSAFITTGLISTIALKAAERYGGFERYLRLIL